MPHQRNAFNTGKNSMTLAAEPTLQRTEVRAPMCLWASQNFEFRTRTLNRREARTFPSP